MAKPKVVVSAPLPADLRERVEAECEILEVPVGVSPLEKLTQDELSSVEGYLTTVRTKFDEEVLKKLPSLKVVSNFAVGYDNVDVDAATNANVLICNTPKVLDGAVADIAIGLMLCLTRDMVNGDAYVRDGSWAAKGAPALTSDMRGKTLGLLGMGRIGRVVAKTAKAFDMKVLYHNRNRCDISEKDGLAEYCDRDTLFSEADFVSVHVPLTEETQGSITLREFKLMKPTAYFINTARGGVVNEKDLITALSTNEIAGAGLDVMVKEPLPADSPLCKMKNVVLQAHVGSGTVETRRAMIQLAVDNLLDALSKNKPEAMVNPQVWGQV